MKLQVLSSLLAILSYQDLWALAQGNDGVNVSDNFIG
jgi:hypothetical protein